MMHHNWGERGNHPTLAWKRGAWIPRSRLRRFFVSEYYYVISRFQMSNLPPEGGKLHRLVHQSMPYFHISAFSKRRPTALDNTSTCKNWSTTYTCMALDHVPNLPQLKGSEPVRGCHSIELLFPITIVEGITTYMFSFRIV